MRHIILTSSTMTAMLAAVPAVADPIVDGTNVFVFGGVFQNEFVWETTAFWRDHYEDNLFLGVGYQSFLAEVPANFHVGIEAGVGLRVGEISSAEVWGGLVMKNEGLTFGDITISPAATGGISIVTNTIGVETDRAGWQGRPVNTLFYFGPEIALSHAELPGFEAFTRIQHRSGGYGIIAEIDGSNAATVGLRLKL